MGTLIGIVVVIGIIVLFTNSKNKTKSVEKSVQNSNRHKRHSPKVAFAKNSDDFYNVIFNSMLETGMFAYPKYSDKQDDMLFAVLGDGTAWANKNNPSSEVSIYVFHWLKYLSQKNTLVYNQILNIAYNNERISDEAKKHYILNTIRSKNIEDLFSDSTAVDAMFKRVKVYTSMIDRLTNTLLSFWSKHEDDANFYVSKINKNYPITEKISHNNLTIKDVENIFLRDMLSGKSLE